MLITHQDESSIPREQQAPLTSALCDTAVSAGANSAVQRKGGNKAALPRRRLPLSLQFKTNFLPSKERNKGLLSLVLDPSVLSGSAP